MGVTISTEKNGDNVLIGITRGFGFNLRSVPKKVFIPMIIHKYATDCAFQSMSGKIMHYSWYHPQAKILCNRGMRIINIDVERRKKSRRNSWARIYDMTPWKPEFMLWIKFFIWYREVAVVDPVEAAAHRDPLVLGPDGRRVVVDDRLAAWRQSNSF